MTLFLHLIDRLTPVHPDPWTAAQEAFARREQEARRRGDTRAIGRVRQERRSFAHATLGGAA